ncbi:MAG: hypothetical protein ACI39G_01605 [Pseudoramibacter sp.]
MFTNDFTRARQWIDGADALLITASNGLSITEGYNIFADNADFRHYFGTFRDRYGINSLIRGVFTPMAPEDKKAYLDTVHRFLIDDYSGSTVMQDLRRLVQNQDHFILTSNGGTHFQINGFDPDQIFEIEGNFDGLEEGTPEWEAQRTRFLDFVKRRLPDRVVLFELGIGAKNQLIKAPAMSLAAAHPAWQFITMNLPGEINVPQALDARTVALTGDIGENLNRLLTIPQ